jgi:hypothetical protein
VYFFGAHALGHLIFGQIGHLWMGTQLHVAAAAHVPMVFGVALFYRKADGGSRLFLMTVQDDRYGVASSFQVHSGLLKGGPHHANKRSTL